MNTMAGFETVRSFLATKTGAEHQALHDHPLFSKLVSEELTAEEYAACIDAQFRAFQGIEAARQRLDAYGDFTLMPQISALSEDLDHPTAPQEELPFTTPDEVLGALYVAHGSQFGRAVIRRALQTNLPNEPRAYFDMPTDAKGWRTFLQAMEATDPGKSDAVLHGATVAFELMHKEADAARSRMVEMALQP
ncbi:MAG: biliverdin-producing heme oxygenase [Pseudomonadota bacterium]